MSDCIRCIKNHNTNVQKGDIQCDICKRSFCKPCLKDHDKYNECYFDNDKYDDNECYICGLKPAFYDYGIHKTICVYHI